MISLIFVISREDKSTGIHYSTDTDVQGVNIEGSREVERESDERRTVKV